MNYQVTGIQLILLRLGHRSRGRPRKRTKPTENKPSQKLKSGVKVKYKLNDGDNWTTVNLLDRAGKKGGRHDGAWKFKDTNGEERWLNFNKDVNDWSIVNEPEIKKDQIEGDIEAEVHMAEKYVKEIKHNVQPTELELWKYNKAYIELENTQKYSSAKFV